MPGAASLEARQYYGHPRNAFWSVAEVLGIDRHLAYRSRCARLKHLGFALWDVIGSCERSGSLDQAIRNARLNELMPFAAKHRALARVWFNGQAAAKHFERELGRAFRAAQPEVELRTLPSTSPANTQQAKYSVWSRALDEAARSAHSNESPSSVLARRFPI